MNKRKEKIRSLSHEFKNKRTTSPDWNKLYYNKQDINMQTNIYDEIDKETPFQLSAINRDKEMKNIITEESKDIRAFKNKKRVKKLNRKLLKTKGKQEKGWTWKKTQWKKLYCECFLKQKECTPACSCYNCWNTHQNTEEIYKIRKEILTKNPNAFSDKLKILNNKSNNGISRESVSIHSLGCKWK